MKITPYQGKSSKTGQTFNCFKLEIGDWETFIFPKTKFEYKYLSDLIGEGLEGV